eukprot:m51a1_g5344 hypothetical protein (1161) ;mRNA; r:440682-445813
MSLRSTRRSRAATAACQASTLRSTSRIASQRDFAGSQAPASAAPAFSFRPRTGLLDWGLLARVDPARIARDCDIEALNALVEMVTFADVEGEAWRVDAGYVKVMQLAQMMIEYLHASQRRLAQHLGAAQSRLAEALADRSSLAQRTRAQEIELGTLRRERRQLRKAVEALELAIKTGAPLVSPTHYRCPMCLKAFKDREFLAKHVERRHPEHRDSPAIAAALAPYPDARSAHVREPLVVDTERQMRERERDQVLAQATQQVAQQARLIKEEVAPQIIQTVEASLTELKQRIDVLSEQKKEVNATLGTVLAQEREKIARERDELDKVTAERTLKIHEELCEVKREIRKELCDLRVEAKIKARSDQRETAELAAIPADAGVGEQIETDTDGATPASKPPRRSDKDKRRQGRTQDNKRAGPQQPLSARSTDTETAAEQRRPAARDRDREASKEQVARAVDAAQQQQQQRQQQDEQTILRIQKLEAEKQKKLAERKRSFDAPIKDKLYLLSRYPHSEEEVGQVRSEINELLQATLSKLHAIGNSLTPEQYLGLIEFIEQKRSQELRDARPNTELEVEQLMSGYCQRERIVPPPPLVDRLRAAAEELKAQASQSQASLAQAQRLPAGYEQRDQMPTDDISVLSSPEWLPPKSTSRLEREILGSLADDYSLADEGPQMQQPLSGRADEDYDYSEGPPPLRPVPKAEYDARPAAAQKPVASESDESVSESPRASQFFSPRKKDDGSSASATPRSSAPTTDRSLRSGALDMAAMGGGADGAKLEELDNDDDDELGEIDDSPDEDEVPPSRLQPSQLPEDDEFDDGETAAVADAILQSRDAERDQQRPAQRVPVVAKPIMSRPKPRAAEQPSDEDDDIEDVESAEDDDDDEFGGSPVPTPAKGKAAPAASPAPAAAGRKEMPRIDDLEEEDYSEPTPTPHKPSASATPGPGDGDGEDEDEDEDLVGVGEDEDDIAIPSQEDQEDDDEEAEVDADDDGVHDDDDDDDKSPVSNPPLPASKKTAAPDDGDGKDDVDVEDIEELHDASGGVVDDEDDEGAAGHGQVDSDDGDAAASHDDDGDGDDQDDSEKVSGAGGGDDDEDDDDVAAAHGGADDDDDDDVAAAHGGGDDVDEELMGSRDEKPVVAQAPQPKPGGGGDDDDYNWDEETIQA